VPHSELPDTFTEVGRDHDIRVVLTGTGDEFSRARANTAPRSLARGIIANAYAAARGVAGDGTIDLLHDDWRQAQRGLVQQ
jgi:hypothetical protein